MNKIIQFPVARCAEPEQLCYPEVLKLAVR